VICNKKAAFDKTTSMKLPSWLAASVVGGGSNEIVSHYGFFDKQ
jgi:hypothetical protein